MQNIRHTILSLLLNLLSMMTFGQNLNGEIHDRQTGESVAGASVYLIGQQIGAYADEYGNFTLEGWNGEPDRLVVSMLEYERDTLAVTAENAENLKIWLTSLEQEAVVITGTMRPVSISRSPVKVEVLSREFLRQIPSNNFTEVIEYVNGVSKQVGCGVCGTADIHINGMEGAYTLMLIDGMPIVSGLGTVYGLEGIPNSLIERIEIVKGPASTLYGSESMAGTVNIITRDALSAPRIHLSTWGSSDRERNVDLSFAQRVGKARTLFSANHYGLENRIDRNGDGFTDLPPAERYSFFNKWSLDRSGNKAADLAAKVYYEDRFGGLLDWQQENLGSSDVYGEYIETRRAELLGNYDLPGRENFNLKFSFAHHDQDSYYGDTRYAAIQQNGFLNFVWYKEPDARHHITAGTALRYQYYNDNTVATPAPEQRIIPGIFIEDEYDLRDNLTLLGGLRMDHDVDHGFIWSPRANVRYKPGRFSTLRLTGGTGFRNVNLFTEDHAALTGARTVIIEEELAPERSFNLTFNYNQILNIGESAFNLDADAFYTYFTNRIIPDYDADPNLIVYRNLTGHSIVRGVAARISQSFRFPLSWDAGITIMEVFQELPDGTKEWQEFAPVVSGVWSLNYQWNALRTRISYTGRLTGPMALPTYDAPYERAEISPTFSVQNITANTALNKQWELQIGVRNLFNYTQDSPLINPGAPFSDAFDTAYAYGPLQGRRLILGLQWQLAAK